MIGHWTTLLEGIVADPSTHARASAPAHRRGIAADPADWNATQRDIPHSTLPHWFAAQAQRCPTRPRSHSAMCAGAIATLDRRADALAARLRARRRRRRRRWSRSRSSVARHGRGPARHPAKAGAAYLPLDPAFPAQRLALIIEDARPAAAAHPARSSKPAADGRRAGRAVLTMTATPAMRPMRDIPPIDPTSLAYVIYTSARPASRRAWRFRIARWSTSWPRCSATPGLRARTICCSP